MEWPPPGRKPPPSLPPSRWQTSNFSSSLFVPGRTCWSWHFLVVWTSPWCPHLSVYISSLLLLQLVTGPSKIAQGLLTQILSLAGAATSIIFVVTKVLWRQNYVCRNKIIVCDWQIVCDKSEQKLFVTKNNNCHDNFFVATKMILVAAPTSDKISVLYITISCGNINRNNKQTNKKWINVLNIFLWQVSYTDWLFLCPLP